MELTPKQHELLEVIGRQDVSQDSWDDTDNLYQLGLMMQDKILSARIFRAARRFGLDRQDLLGAITQARRNKNGHSTHEPTLPPPETLTELIAADIPAPLKLFDGLMHEGMLLFGGKSKRGKSWLMFDLALSLAVGRSGFRHFDCPEARPILYLALEDGRARLQGRAKMIQPNPDDGE